MMMGGFNFGIKEMVDVMKPVLAKMGCPSVEALQVSSLDEMAKYVECSVKEITYFGKASDVDKEFFHYHSMALEYIKAGVGLARLPGADVRLISILEICSVIHTNFMHIFVYEIMQRFSSLQDRDMIPVLLQGLSGEFAWYGVPAKPGIPSHEASLPRERLN